MLGQVIGRWGNFVNAEAYGYSAGVEKLPWRMTVGTVYIDGVPHPEIEFVHPTFLYESLWNLLGFILINLFYRHKKRDGQVFYLYVAWYGLGRGLLEFLRTDSLRVFGLKAFVILGLGSFVAAVLLLIVSYRRAAAEREELEAYASANAAKPAPKTAPEPDGTLDAPWTMTARTTAAKIQKSTKAKEKTMAILLDGKLTSAKVKEEVAAKFSGGLRGRQSPCPALAVVIVGDNPASKVYVANKKKACEAVGIRSLSYELPGETTQDELLALVDRLNGDADVNGILVQLPLPRHIDEQTVIERISPDKDVDAFHPSNVGRIMLGLDGFAPCTPAGIMRLLAEYGISAAGKNCVVVGRSNIVGKPMAMLLLHQHGTVTICHSRTADLPSVTRRADILVVAVGRAKFVTADMVKPGAVVIDVGMNRDENGKLCGDVDFAEVSEVAGAITPVPGGVGPMTITMLMRNTITAAKK